MRLIDADALKVDYYDEYNADGDEYVYRYYSEQQIENAPTIEAYTKEDIDKAYAKGFADGKKDYIKASFKKSAGDKNPAAF